MKLEEEEVFFIIGFFVILLVIIYFIGFMNRHEANDYPTEAMYIRPWQCNNGDIVCASYYNMAGGFVTSISRSIWSHTGTIWVDPKTSIRYVLEGAIYLHESYKHFIKIPLVTWLHFNRKSLLGFKKYHGPILDSDFIWSKFKWLYDDCKLEGFTVLWSRFLFDKAHYEYSRKNKYTCLEGTVILGQEIGIFKKDKIYSSYYPGNIVNNEICLCDGISYDLPIKIKLHPSDQEILLEDIATYKDYWQKK